MNYTPGTILLIRDFRLPSQEKDKFFIVLGSDENGIRLLSMTTSKIYFDVSLLKHGPITDRDLSVYCFEAKRVIGQNGFFFRKHTVVSHRQNIHYFGADRFAAYKIEFQDILLKEELIDLLYSFYTYKGTKKKDKKILETLLSDLTS